MTTGSPVSGPRARAARVPLLESREGLSPAQQEAWDAIAESRGRVVGPFAVLLHSPEVARRVAALGHLLRFEGRLSAVERELAILAVARALDCQFEWAAHAPLARRAGVREDA
ncbi:MAG TPA: carboxymuconolactone decarboxylase family protein, partial [Candidatus Tectomicrobia bacterium]|nr:carboxymuconolactone decarboxylase family protein [Candidatus Tectomicrobia bacterium]